MAVGSGDVTDGTSAGDGTQYSMKIVWPLIIIVLEVLILAVIIGIHEYVQKRKKLSGEQEKSVLADMNLFFVVNFSHIRNFIP